MGKSSRISCMLTIIDLLMANPIKSIIILLSCLANLQHITCASSYRLQSPIFQQKRGDYNIWDAAGSDGYLYDFVKRNGIKESMMLPHLQSYLEKAKIEIQHSGSVWV